MSRMPLCVLLLYLVSAAAAEPIAGETDERGQQASNAEALEAAPSEEAIQRESEVQEDPLTQRQEKTATLGEQIRWELESRSWSAYLSARLRYRHGGDKWLFGDGGSRAGLQGDYRLTTGLRLFGLVEAGFNLADELDALLNPGNQSGSGTTVFTRLAYAGIETSRLNLTVGKNWSTYYQIASFTDRLISFGGSGTQFANAGSDGGATGTGRADSVLQMRFMVDAIPDDWWFKPFRLNLQVQRGHAIPEVAGNHYGTNFGASAILHLRNEFILGIAYNYAPIDTSPATWRAGIRGDEEALLLGTRWFGDDWYLGATMARLKNHATTDTGQYFDGLGAELYGKYRLLPKLWLTAGWNLLRPDDGSIQAGRFRTQYLVPGLLYELRGPRRFLYLEYKRENSRHADGSPYDDVLTVGIRWDFRREG